MECGIDEAGKGPVLGSMFAVAVRAPRAAIPDGVDDSKRLSATRRASMADRLRADDRVAIGRAEIPPDRLDAENVNRVTVAAHAEALSAVAEAGDVCVCDAADVDEARFARRVADAIDGEVTIEATHGADETDVLVSAASVLAKEAREAHVETLREAYGEVGSGYPSDPTTRSFLREYVAKHDELPPCARASWSTSQDVLAAAEQSRLGEF